MNIAVITGASSGLGKVITEEIHNFFVFDEVWIISRSEEKLKKVNCKFKTKIISLDLQIYENLLNFKNLLKEENPNISLLINCAGYGKFGSYNAVNLDSSLGMIDLNCRALTAVTEICIPYMKNNSQILQVCSVASFIPLPKLNIYSASKAFVFNYSLALRNELKPKGIYVSVICPNWIDTEFLSVAENTATPKAIKSYMFKKSPEFIANKALIGLKKKKHLILPSAFCKVFFVLSRILPKPLLIKLWLTNTNKD